MKIVIPKPGPEFGFLPKDVPSDLPNAATQERHDFSSDHATSSSLSETEAASKEPDVEGSFTIFGELPVEIRLKIWKFASNQGLIIDLWSQHHQCHIENNGSFYHQRYFTHFTDTLCRVLGADRESREEVRLSC
jgi:hypothetical protein